MNFLSGLPTGSDITGWDLQLKIMEKLPSPITMWIFAVGAMHFVALQWPKDEISWWPDGADNSLVWFSCIAIFGATAAIGVIYNNITKKKKEDHNEGHYKHDIEFFNGINKFLFIILIVSFVITTFLFISLLILPSVL